MFGEIPGNAARSDDTEIKTAKAKRLYRRKVSFERYKAVEYTMNMPPMREASTTVYCTVLAFLEKSGGVHFVVHNVGRPAVAVILHFSNEEIAKGTPAGADFAYIANVCGS